MSDRDADDAGVMMALVARFESQRLPRLLDIKAMVDGGARLSDLDITFLAAVLDDARRFRALLVRHPEYEALASRAASLYHEITERALANEERASGAD